MKPGLSVSACVWQVQAGQGHRPDFQMLLLEVPDRPLPPPTGAWHTQVPASLEVCARCARSPVGIWSSGVDQGGRAVTINQSSLVHIRNKTDHFISLHEMMTKLLKALKCPVFKSSVQRQTPTKVFVSCNLVHKEQSLGFRAIHAALFPLAE